MKNLLKAAPVALLALAACVSTPYMIETQGPFQRTVERVVERHDAYVLADEDMGDAAESEALAQSASLSALVQQPEVSGSLLFSAFAPVADRHDAYVALYETDVLERNIYLGDTQAVRDLLGEAASHEPGQ